MNPACDLFIFLLTFSSSRCSSTHPDLQSATDVDLSSLSTPMASGHHRSRSHRSQKPSRRHLDSSMRQHSQQQMIPVYDFDMSQIRNAICAISSDQPESVPRKPRLSNTIPSNSNNFVEDPVDSKLKRDRIKSLWGKARKQGLLQAAAAKRSSGSTPAVMSQSQIHDGPVVFPYFNTTVGGEASGGSGFYGQPGNATMECDCGDDSCTKCNLMLNMGSCYWHCTWKGLIVLFSVKSIIYLLGIITGERVSTNAF